PRVVSGGRSGLDADPAGARGALPARRRPRAGLANTAEIFPAKVTVWWPCRRVRNGGLETTVHSVGQKITEATMKRSETRTATAAQVLAPSWDESSSGGWAKVLATFPLFSDVSRRQLRKLARQATFAEFAPGDIVVSNPESADSLYIILSGSAKVLGKPAARSLSTGD